MRKMCGSYPQIFKKCKIGVNPLFYWCKRGFISTSANGFKKWSKNDV